MCRRLLILIGMVVATLTVAAQTTRVRGRVTDAATGRPIPFVSVLFPGTTTGITTDENGVYALESRDTVSRIEATFMGYHPQTKSVRLRCFNTVDFALETADFAIEQVVVTPGENPSHPILKEAIRRKALNNPDEYERYSCETYTKMQLDLANVKTFKSKRMQRNFGFIFDYVDTSALTGSPYLPMMISETKASLYHSKQPSFTREVIEANRVSGIEDTFSIAQFTGHINGDVNFYHNFIEVFGVRFAGPLAESGLSFYNYFLVDSLEVEGRKTYKIRFHPKRTATPVLDGEIHIDSATYALQSASARMPRGVNVNWIKSLQLSAKNRMVDSMRWFRERDRMEAEFSVTRSDSSKLISFIGSREVGYTQVDLDGPIPQQVLDLNNNVTLSSEEPSNFDERYWEQVRPYALSERERSIYEMVDSVQQLPLYRNIYTVINTVIVGYYNTKYIGIGPYYKLLSFNDLEGLRPQIGARTTSEVSKRWRLTGYVAYGTDDERFKGGGTLEWMFRRDLTRKLTLHAKHDVVQLGAGQNALTESNILSSIFSRGGERLSMVDMGELTYEHEWIHGISNRLSANVQRIEGNRFVPMLTPELKPVSAVNDYSISLSTRISKQEKIYRQIFDKRYLGSKYPILQLDLTGGYATLPDFREPYARMQLGVRYDPKLPPIGHSEILLQAGHLFGRLPYPLLKLQEGNGTYFYDPYAFSCMNYYEFATDSWLSLFYEHHFGGWFLGRIPLLRKLQLREVFTFKGVWGTLSKRNGNPLREPLSQAPLCYPLSMESVETPYLEVGVGVENIIRFFRVDCIWRLTHRDSKPGQRVQNFAVNLSLRLTF